MKGRMYKPFSSIPTSPRERLPHCRPWAGDDPNPKIYMWRSSIPEAWVKIKGSNGFKHVSEAGTNQNTVDFLRTNQKYISSIACPPSKTPSNNSALTSREPSRPGSKEQSRVHSHDLANFKDPLIANTVSEFPMSPVVQEKPNDLKNDSFKNAVQCVIPESGKKLLTSSSLKYFKFNLKEEEEKNECNPNNTNSPTNANNANNLINETEQGYCVNRYSLPKLLIRKKKAEQFTPRFKNTKVNEFLNRFDKNQEPTTPASERRGLNGWKLVALRRRL